MACADESRLPASYRGYAFLAQLAISGALLAGLYFGLLRPWFSAPLFLAEGGHYLLMLIAGVDFVLGPLLTLVAVSPNKSRRLVKQDLLTTSALRGLALAGGIWLCWESRPAAVIWLDEAFHTLPWSSLREEPKSRDFFTSRQGQGPVYLMIELPDDPIERGKIFSAAVEKQTSVLFDSSRYQPFDPQSPRILSFLDTYLARIARNPGHAKALANEGLPPAHASGNPLLLPAISRYETHHLLIDAETGHAIRSVRLEPLLLVGYRRSRH